MLIIRARLIIRDRKTEEQKDKEKSSALRFLRGKREGRFNKKLVTI